ETRATVDTFIDSTAIQLRTSLDQRIRPGLDSTAAVVLDRALRDLALAERGLADSLRGPIAAAIEHLVRRNLAATREESMILADRLTAVLARDLDTRLRPGGMAAGRDLVAAMTRQLASDLQDSVRVAAESLATSAIRKAVLAADEGTKRSSLMRTILTVFGIVVALVLIGFGVRIWRGERRARQALSVVTGAVQQQGDGRLKNEIQSRARGEKVEEWLHQFLVNHGHLDMSASPPVSGGGGPGKEGDR
ncbi:MAG: hypothetical protein FD129_1235, partial [bacterium]